MKENKSFNERERVSFEIPWKEKEGGAWENRGKFSNVREGIRVAENRGESMCPGEIELYTVKTRVVYRQTTGATIEIPKWWVVLHAYSDFPSAPIAGNLSSFVLLRYFDR